MKLIIDIPDMIYNILNGDSSWKGLSIDYILNAVKDGTPLEAQPTDAVSRSEAINSIKYKSDVEKELRNQNKKYIEGYDDVRWIKGYEEGLDDAITIINSLPPVAPQRPQGKWILIHPLQEDDGGAYMCSNCLVGNWSYSSDYKYCPNCGAEMEVNNADSD